MKQDTTYDHLLPFVVLYFTANNFLLPHGLLYTTLLTPVFLYWLFKSTGLQSLLKWTILLLIPIPFHLFGGVELKSYLVSSTLVITAWIFLFTALNAVSSMGEGIQKAFKVILLINSVFIVLAFFILPFDPLRDLMWYSIPISPDIPGFPRLKLLSYESSHYALLLTPVFLFFILKAMTGKSRRPLFVLAAAVLPLLLSLSFGVIAALLIALLVGSIAYHRYLPRYYYRFSFYTLVIFSLGGLLLFVFWPDNPVFARIGNILSGTDTSAKGRLHDSFMFAYDLIRNGKLIMGIGPGQIKVLAHDLIINYYKYTGEFAEIVRIPNSMAEMLATYGFYGFLLKLFFLIYFFIKLRIYNNFFTLVLFLFLFIYQFTGSFIVNIAEMGTWAIIYQSRLKLFDHDQLAVQST
jgi:hypothetical protein